MISVVIPIYDRTAMLQESIESILHQSYQDFELILVTDGSPADTLNVVKHYESNPKVKVFYYYDRSGSACRGRNKGIKEARGEYVAFQDSDDIASPDRLKLSLSYAETNCADVVYGGWMAKVEMRDHPSGVKDKACILSPDLTPGLLRNINALNLSTVMARRSALIDVGGLKRKFEYLEDWELWLRLEHFGYKFKAIPETLTTVRLHSGNHELVKKPGIDKWRHLMMQEYQTKGRMPCKIAYMLPGTGISGGAQMILQHTNRLLQRGYDTVLLLTAPADRGDLSWFPDNKVPMVRLGAILNYQVENIDHLVATGWQTVSHMDRIKAPNKYYFVQADERGFGETESHRAQVAETYKKPLKYFTEAKWIVKWLAQEFGQEAKYVFNGLDTTIFRNVSRSNGCRRPRILVEGAICLPWKGVADAYRAIEGLDAEVWMVTNGGRPLPEWKVDKFFYQVPHHKMPEIYSECDVLIKMSRCEGFFGPPMEAMACGCAVVTGKVSGYDEYIVAGENALVVEEGDIAGAREAVKRILEEPFLKNKLIYNGYITAQQWPWDGAINLLERVFEG